MASADLARLRARIAAIEGRPAPASASGGPSGDDSAADRRGSAPPASGGSAFFAVPTLDRLFPNGFAAASLHAFVATTARDGGALAGFAIAVALRFLAASGGSRAILWANEARVRGESGGLHGPGAAAIGLDPGRLLLVEGRRPADVLWAMEEGLAGGVALVIGEVRGDSKALDLTASRRLAMRSERAGVPALLLLDGGGERASAARSRWLVSPSPSRASPDRRAAAFPRAAASGTRGSPEPPGPPVWRLRLDRNRDGPCGEALVGFCAETARFIAPETVPAAARPGPSPRSGGSGGRANDACDRPGGGGAGALVAFPRGVEGVSCKAGEGV